MEAAEHEPEVCERFFFLYTRRRKFSLGESAESVR